MPLLPLIAAKSQKRQRHSAVKAGEPPPPRKSKLKQDIITTVRQFSTCNEQSLNLANVQKCQHYQLS